MASETTAPAPHWWTTLLSISAMAISFFGLMVSCQNSRQVKKFNRTHVQPDVMCTVRHSTDIRWTNVPWAAELVILNRGPIKAASVYVAYQTWVIDTNYWWPYGNPHIAEYLNKDYSFVTPELDVGEGRIQGILSVGPMAVYEVEISYYRPTDMEKFTQKAIFFYQDGQFNDQIGFKQKSFYIDLMKNLERRKAGKGGILPKGKSVPPPDYTLPSFLFHVPETSEPPRPLKPVDFH